MYVTQPELAKEDMQGEAESIARQEGTAGHRFKSDHRLQNFCGCGCCVRSRLRVLTPTLTPTHGIASECCLHASCLPVLACTARQDKVQLTLNRPISVVVC